MTPTDHRELARRANDKIKVFNPTSQDYVCYWDGYLHIIPAKDTDRGHGPGCAVLPRYIARKYVIEMTNKILLERQDELVKKENEKRLKEGKRPMEKWAGEEQQILEDKFRFTGGVQDPQAREEIIKSLVVGLVEEYGRDVPRLEPLPRENVTDDDLLEKAIAKQLPPIYETAAKNK